MLPHDVCVGRPGGEGSAGEVAAGLWGSLACEKSNQLTG